MNAHGKLLSAYKQLSALEQSVLQLLSITYGAINQTQLLDCLKALKLKAENGNDFGQGSSKDGFKAIRPTLDHLIELGWLDSRTRIILNRDVVEIITRQSVEENKFMTYLQAAQSIPKLSEASLSKMGSPDGDYFIAVIRMLFYQKKSYAIDSLYSQYADKVNYLPLLSTLLEKISCSPFDPKWFELLPLEKRTQILEGPLDQDLFRWQHQAKYFDYLEQLVLFDSPKCEARLKGKVLEKWVLCGEKQRVQQWLKKYATQENENGLCLQGWLAFLEGNNEQAIHYYETGLKRLAVLTTKSRGYFNNFSGIFFILALLKDNTPQRLEEARGYLNIASNHDYLFHEVYECLRSPLSLLTGKSKQAQAVFSHFFYVGSDRYGLDYIKSFFECFTFYWVDQDQAKSKLDQIKTLSDRAKNSEYWWFYEELELLIKSLSSQKKETSKEVEVSSLLGVVQRSNIWEQTLNSLLALKQPAKKSDKTVSEKESASDLRMVWFLTCNNSGGCSAAPREQKRNAKGQWSKGRPIALQKLHENLTQYPYVTQQDKEILHHIYPHQYQDGWYTNTEYIFREDYLFSVIGHPLIFWEDGETKVELTKGKPELLVSQQKNGSFLLYLSPAPSKYRDDYHAIKETPTRIKLVKINDDYHRVADILGEGITVPASAKAKVQQIIDKLASDILIHSDIEGESSQLKEVEADSKIHIHLLPAARGLKLAMFVRPVQGGAYYHPGSGGKMVISEVKGVQLQTVRNLEQEKKEAAALIRNCPTLQQIEGALGEWVLEDPSDCLEVLLELGALNENIVLEWPEGEKFKLLGQPSLKQFHLNINRQQDWFMATGSVQLDEQLVVDMQRLLELVATAPSRFLEIKEGEFIALTQEFYKRLQELNRYSEKHGNGVRFHPLAAIALEGLTHDVGQLQTDKSWKTHIQKLQIIDEDRFPVPSTLQAELRGYQLQGVHWLSRLSHWEVGACLADDMGLGKTIQAIAMLLKYAPEGPSLVIAPTSVCMNWLAETKRFAPTLNIIQFGSTHRKKVLDALSPFDVFVCSYGLLQQKEVAEMLGQISWQMVVLDEAQAIKNIVTKRSQAAMTLQAKFKLIMTGTPIENHLGELWNLFHFINPGLLGSFEQFNLKFVLPIERDNDSHARQHLKKLIQPFILRRIKSKVLEELPARTEIRLHVELSKEEMAFYEALRQQALKTLSEEDAKGGEKHLKILAEIMKLRRACCNPQLVYPDIALPSSKLAVFGEVLQELLENQHKALVFSQFVGHLSLIRNYLDEQKIHYQYLDGSTSVKDRKLAVDAFQAGEGDVFLISLKAGGFGLNLTAADYVIHMDPWWNPAVEDQASDRAHRIGQQRPVTIYRLITKDTIEEKIVEMHNKKRDLADSLLDGSDMSGKLSTKDLLDLLSE
ncbi:DEAD/DEAH box helicase [Deltaproteobacteria bacterium TL4]